MFHSSSLNQLSERNLPLPTPAEQNPTSPSAEDTKMVRKRITGAMAPVLRWSQQNRYVFHGDPGLGS